MLRCIICDAEFVRPGKRGPIPKYCSQRCITKAGRTPHRVEYERTYRRAERAAGKREAYERAYYRRPEVRARYLARYYAFYRDPFADVELPAPFSGHQWMDKARELVAPLGLDGSAPWADDKYDEMGEALLALLEGKDPAEAVKEFRRKEYVPRNLTLRIDEWTDDEREQQEWYERVMPAVESAESEAVTRETILDRVRYSRGTNTFRNKGRKTKTQPRLRRQKDGRSWQKHL